MYLISYYDYVNYFIKSQFNSINQFPEDNMNISNIENSDHLNKLIDNHRDSNKSLPKFKKQSYSLSISNIPFKKNESKVIYKHSNMLADHYLNSYFPTTLNTTLISNRSSIKKSFSNYKAKENYSNNIEKSDTNDIVFKNDYFQPVSIFQATQITNSVSTFNLIKKIDIKDEIIQIIHLSFFDKGNFFVGLSKSKSKQIITWSISGYFNRIGCEFEIKKLTYCKSHLGGEKFISFHKGFIYFFRLFSNNHFSRLYVFKDKTCTSEIVKFLDKNENSIFQPIVIINYPSLKYVIFYSLDTELIIQKAYLDVCTNIFDYIEYNNVKFFIYSDGSEKFYIKKSNYFLDKDNDIIVVNVKKSITGEEGGVRQFSPIKKIQELTNLINEKKEDSNDNKYNFNNVCNIISNDDEGNAENLNISNNKNITCDDNNDKTKTIIKEEINSLRKHVYSKTEIPSNLISNNINNNQDSHSSSNLVSEVYDAFTTDKIEVFSTESQVIACLFFSFNKNKNNDFVFTTNQENLENKESDLFCLISLTSSKEKCLKILNISQNNKIVYCKMLDFSVTDMRYFNMNIDGYLFYHYIIGHGKGKQLIWKLKFENDNFTEDINNNEINQITSNINIDSFLSKKNTKTFSSFNQNNSNTSRIKSNTIASTNNNNTSNNIAGNIFSNLPNKNLVRMNSKTSFKSLTSISSNNSNITGNFLIQELNTNNDFNFNIANIQSNSNKKINSKKEKTETAVKVIAYGDIEVQYTRKIIITYNENKKHNKTIKVWIQCEDK